MLLDTHCHIDLFSDPIGLAKAYESSNIACVMVTLLPNFYQASLTHLRAFRWIYPALGIHPLRASEGKKEIALFENLVAGSNYIGEIGLDLSAKGKPSKSVQFEVLNSILPLIGPRKFVSVHSRGAHEEVAQLLEQHNVGPVCFHYYTGSLTAAREIASQGHFFSFNKRMLETKHQRLLDHVPTTQVLVESDGPFLTNSPTSTIASVYSGLSAQWGEKEHQVEKIISENFDRCRTTLS